MHTCKRKCMLVHRRVYTDAKNHIHVLHVRMLYMSKSHVKGTPQLRLVQQRNMRTKRTPHQTAGIPRSSGRHPKEAKGKEFQQAKGRAPKNSREGLQETQGKGIPRSRWELWITYETFQIIFYQFLTRCHVVCIVDYKAAEACPTCSSRRSPWLRLSLAGSPRTLSLPARSRQGPRSAAGIAN